MTPSRARHHLPQPEKGYHLPRPEKERVTKPVAVIEGVRTAPKTPCALALTTSLTTPSGRSATNWGWQCPSWYVLCQDKLELIHRIQTSKGEKQVENGQDKSLRKDSPNTRESKKPRTATEYNLFMREQIAIVKAGDPVLTHKEVFKRAACNWAAMRIRNQVEEMDSAQRTRGEGGSDPNKDGNKESQEVAKTKEGSKDVTVLEKIKCGICLETLYKSVTFVPCQHNFCDGCYLECMEQSERESVCVVYWYSI
jgi:hypothetical protein